MRVERCTLWRVDREASHVLAIKRRYWSRPCKQPGFSVKTPVIILWAQRTVPSSPESMELTNHSVLSFRHQVKEPHLL